MYNKSLDVFKAVAESTSFSKAAEKLYISHTAVIKQINQLESHLGVKLIKRSSRGIILTTAGQQLYKETLDIIKASDEAVKRVQNAYYTSPQTLLVGSSILYPCHSFMSIWDTINELCPQYQLKIVSFDDDEKRLDYLNDTYDFVIGAYNQSLEQEGYQFFPIGNYSFSIAMPRKHPLSKKPYVKLDDLTGQKLMIMTAGTSPINDQIRQEIEQDHPSITLVDISSKYSIDTFNHCADENMLLLSLDCWKYVHPALVSVELKEDYRMPYGILLSDNHDSKLDSFISALQAALNKEILPR